MSDAAFLSEAEEVTLGIDLAALLIDLRASLSASETAARPVDLDEPIGRLSRVDALQQQSMVKATRAAAHRRVELVEAALRRHEAGEYGTCLACGEAVGFPRLKARPETPFCLACQSRRESAQRGS